MPPILPSARSPITATRARTRDYTASLLLNKRVRSVVDEANGLMHLRPRESTSSARECSAKHRHELWSSKHATSRQQFAKPHPQICPQSPSARSPLTATTVQPRDSASLLSHKRVRGVVHGETMHLRPRVSTYSAVTENPCHYRHRHTGTFCLPTGEKIWGCRDCPRRQSRERGKKRGCGRQPGRMYQSRLQQRSTATAARLQVYAAPLLKSR